MGNSKQKYFLGTINLNTEVYISDPCYEIGTWCQALVKGLKPGQYNCYMTKVDEGDWGLRVSDVWITHIDYKDIYPKAKIEATIGVDSGAAGIYDKEYYEKYHTLNGENIRDIPESKEWYDNQFNLRYNYDIEGKKIKEVWDKDKFRYVRTQPPRDGIVIDGKCVITESGLGDGTYTTYSYTNPKKEIVGIRISFL